ncbi:MAG: fasciclin domain-containing protein [Prolixibacteraceae bacterium]
MRPKIGILFIVIIFTVIGCSKTWDDHYFKQPDTINMNVWDAITSRSDLSKFVDLMVKYNYDTLFLSNDTYTLFVPDNSAFDKINQFQQLDSTNLNYLISRHFIQPIDIQGKRKLQTLEEKYSTFENIGGTPTYDGIVLNFESPLYLNGKFFVMSEVALPKLNIYEFYKKNNPYFINYVDKQDSIILDKENSRPIGFNEKGETVYDTVSVTVNLFELKYFAISKEYRNQTATFVYPKLDNYQNALTEMALKLGGNFHSYSDIPVKWQEDVLIPHLVEHGTFLNMLEVSEFKPLRIRHNDTIPNMINFRGDSIVVNYTPTDKYLCSNGVTYDYTNFAIPDSLFSGAEKFEGEWLARTTGANKFAWRSNVTVTSTNFFGVVNNYINDASNDSILIVNFSKGYSGSFSLQFNTRNLFPRRYRMVVSTHMDIGGIYDIYVNDILVKTFDYYDYVRSRGLIKSVTGDMFVPVGRYHKFDCYLDNITEYGRPTIRFEYKGPGSGIPNNGLVLDVIEFLPVQ